MHLRSQIYRWMYGKFEKLSKCNRVDNDIWLSWIILPKLYNYGEMFVDRDSKHVTISLVYCTWKSRKNWKYNEQKFLFQYTTCAKFNFGINYLLLDSHTNTFVGFAYPSRWHWQPWYGILEVPLLPTCSTQGPITNIY